MLMQNIDRIFVEKFPSLRMPLTLYQTKNILDWLKLRAFADDKINVIENLEFL